MMVDNKLLLGLVLSLVMLTACAEFLGNAEDRKYFTGREGVDIAFEGNSPPRELFYRGEDVPFEVAVRVENEGASITKGGLYVSGYDSTIIDMANVEEGSGLFTNCNYDIGTIGYGKFQATAQCQEIRIGEAVARIGVSYGEGDFQVRLDDLNLGELLDDAFDTDIFTEAGFNEANVDISLIDGDFRIDIDFENDRFDPQKTRRGAYLLAAWEGIDFTLNGGKEFKLKGDSPIFPGGEEDIVTFYGNVTNLPRGRDKTTQPLMVTACYLYSTHAAPMVCIDRNPYSDDEKTCRPSRYTSSRGQGAPVAITSVSQQSSGNEMVFRIEMQNIGDGTVYNPTRIQTCSPYYPLPATEEDLNEVVLGMVYIGEDMLECVPDKHTVRLYNGRGVAKCVYNLENQGVVSRTGYETPLIVELWYGYSETIRRDLTIQRI